jgi:hypothetical protein
MGGDGFTFECLNGVLPRVQKEAGVDIDNPEAKLQRMNIPIGVLPVGKLFYQCVSCFTSV